MAAMFIPHSLAFASIPRTPLSRGKHTIRVRDIRRSLFKSPFGKECFLRGQLLQVKMKLFLKQLLSWRRYLILILTPVLFAPIPIILQAREARCAYAILIMAIFWVTEVIPLAVTALLPLVLFPMLGVLSAQEASLPYLKDTTALFIGGLIVAVAIEHWNLHKRIALRVLLLVGSQPRSNTATTAMMVPIAEAVLQELKRDKIDAVEGGGEKDSKALMDEGKRNETEAEQGVTPSRDQVTKRSNQSEERDSDEEEEDVFFGRMSKALVLCVAYAANIGGTATLTGTGSNLVFNGQAQSIFPDSPAVGFGQWFSYAFPQMILLELVAWAWLQVYFLGCCSCKKTTDKDRMQHQAINRVLRKQYADMGSMTFAEHAVLGHFVVLALLWLSRDPKFMPGWAVMFAKGYVKDATAAMLIAFSLFVFPSQKPKIFCWNPDGGVHKPPPNLLTWNTVAHKMPWNVVFLLGGGFSLAQGAKESGLSEWLGEQLSGLKVVPDYGIVIIVCVMLTGFTEITSNVATVTIFLPILGTVGRSIGTHPWYLMIPATISCSFAFMLPVATPPNAIVFSYGHLKVKDMAKAGFGMNVICITVLLICLHVYGTSLFGLDTVPDWAKFSTISGARNTSLVCRNVTI
ncbi:solute carrier family 13 member 5 isoform X2 [Nematostella vectensis]|uniref:solute carrier family 13 member 5 isoform X2 n=1 Tax=Nematostella vectensis TaxID=45351 RepID=UPI00207767B2|nr:solute carrier family 13 member 5 isoform X2 [Nematostella vectensis]